MPADCDATAIAAGLSDTDLFVTGLSVAGRFESVADDKSGLILAACADFTASIYQHILRCGATSVALFAPTREYGLFAWQAPPAPTRHEQQHPDGKA